MYTQSSINCWFHNWIWLGDARPLSSTCWMKVGLGEYWRSDRYGREDSWKILRSSHTLCHTHTPDLFLLTHSVSPISNLLSLLALFTGWVHCRSITSNLVWLLWGWWKWRWVQQRPLTCFPCYSCCYRFCCVCILILCVFSFVLRPLSLMDSPVRKETHRSLLSCHPLMSQVSNKTPTMMANTLTHTHPLRISNQPSKSQHASKSPR